jgi:hypothetical protein
VTDNIAWIAYYGCGWVVAIPKNIKKGRDFLKKYNGRGALPLGKVMHVAEGGFQG